MAKFKVFLQITGTLTVYVESTDEESAIDAAFDQYKNASLRGFHRGDPVIQFQVENAGSARVEG